MQSDRQSFVFSNIYKIHYRESRSRQDTVGTGTGVSMWTGYDHDMRRRPGNETKGEELRKSDSGIKMPRRINISQAMMQEHKNGGQTS